MLELLNRDSRKFKAMELDLDEKDDCKDGKGDDDDDEGDCGDGSGSFPLSVSGLSCLHFKHDNPCFA